MPLIPVNQAIKRCFVKKALISSLALVAAVGVSGSAMALNVEAERNITIFYGGQPVEVGRLVCDQGQYVDEYDAAYPYEACRFLCKWVNASYLPSSTNLYIDEIIVPGFADCEENSLYPVPTNIVLAPGFVSKGFDRNNNKREIAALTQSEFGDNTAGTIAFYGGGNFAVVGLQTGCM
jgi:hypothetical protein